MEVKFVGLDDLNLDAGDTATIKELVDKYGEKIQRTVNNELELVVHIKAYAKTGERHKYSVHVRATYPGETITSEKADWQLSLAVRSALEAVEEQLKHKYHD